MNPKFYGKFAAVLLAGAVGLVGCQHETRDDRDHDAPHGEALTNPEPAPATDPEPAPANPAGEIERPMAPAAGGNTAGGTNTTRSGGKVTTTAAFPTGDRATSAVLLEKITPETVALGSPFDYDLRVTNISKNDLENIVVSDQFSEDFEIVSSDPAGKKKDGKQTWAISMLKPGDSKTIKIRGKAKAARDLTSCGDVEYESKVCAIIKVVQPSLALKMDVIKPYEDPCVLRCDPIKIRYTVTNSGTGTAKNVKVVSELPAGLQTLAGRSSLSFNVGDLAGGKAKAFEAQVKATKSGKFAAKADATSDGGLKANATAAEFEICEPKLAMKMSAPKTAYLGRPSKFSVDVENTGSGPCKAPTQVETTMPAGAKLLKASDGGKHVGNKVVWKLEKFAAKSKKSLTLVLEHNKPGAVTLSSKMTCPCTDPVSASAQTEYKGIPAILLEVVDLDDPIGVGEDETYLIIATNQGSAVGTNIKIVAEWESNWDYVGNSGATKGERTGSKVAYAPLPQLAPKAKAEWKLMLKAKTPGDTRFKIEMTSDQLGERPVNETEATNVY